MEVVIKFILFVVGGMIGDGEEFFCFFFLCGLLVSWLLFECILIEVVVVVFFLLFF